MNNMLKFLQAVEPNLTSKNLYWNYCIFSTHVQEPWQEPTLPNYQHQKYEKPTTTMSPPVSVREVGMMMRFLRSCENIAILLLFIIELSARLKANNFQFNQRWKIIR